MREFPRRARDADGVASFDAGDRALDTATARKRLAAAERSELPHTACARCFHELRIPSCAMTRRRDFARVAAAGMTLLSGETRRGAAARYYLRRTLLYVLCQLGFGLPYGVDTGEVIKLID